MPSPEDDNKTSSQSPERSDTSSPTEQGPTAFGLSEEALRAVRVRYELLHLLGRGGMGIVYKARDRVSSDIVALKLLNPEIAAHTSLIERFKSELRLARKVTHKNVCRVYDLSQFGAVHALSMEYVEGETLRQTLRRDGTLSVRRGLMLIRQVIDALEEAHHQGVIHRDLKPENIMVSRDGTVKVMDFGLARATTGDTLSTAPGAVLGTPAYMSPEQAAGKPVDHRSDIYALGLILYEMFTGRKAFEADTPLGLALKHIHDTPQTPASLEPDLPTRIDKAILRCLEKEPKKRFSSVRELDAALTTRGPLDFRTPRPRTSVELPPHLSFWQRRDWLLSGAGVLAFAVFLFLFEHVFPYRFFELGISREGAVARALDVVRTFAPEVRDDNISVLADFERELAPYPGEVFPENLQKVERKYLLYAESWNILFAKGDAKSRTASITFDAGGRLINAVFLQPSVDTDSRSSTPEEILPFAIRCAKDLFSVNVSNIQPIQMERAQDASNSPLRTEVPILLMAKMEMAEMSIGLSPRESPFVVWKLHSDVPRTEEYILISANHDRLLAAERLKADTQEQPDFPWLRELDLNFVSALEEFNQLIWASVIGAGFVGLLALLAIFLSVERRLYLQTPPALLLVATLGALAVSLFTWDHWLRFENIGGWVLVHVLASLVIALLLIYSVLSSAQNYLIRTLPAQAKTLLSLLQRFYKEQSVGFAIVRGIAFGSLFLAAHAVGIWLLSRGSLGAPSAMWLLIYGRNELDAHSGLSIAILVTIVAGWLLLAFPLSLLQRAGSKVPTQLISVAILWSASTATLPGASVTPPWLVYIIAALQGAFFACLLLRWDFLTSLTAIFTVESWLICYPTYRIFAKTDGPNYALGLLPWCALLLLGVIIALRAKLLTSWHRLRVIFE